MLQNGMAYATTPQEGAPGSLLGGGGQTVYPVMPAGAVPAGAQRQFVINTSASVDGTEGGDHAERSDVRMMTFSTSGPGDQIAPPAAGASTPRRKRSGPSSRLELPRRSRLNRNVEFSAAPRSV